MGADTQNVPLTELLRGTVRARRRRASRGGDNRSEEALGRVNDDSTISRITNDRRHERHLDFGTGVRNHHQPILTWPQFDPIDRAKCQAVGSHRDESCQFVRPELIVLEVAARSRINGEQETPQPFCLGPRPHTFKPNKQTFVSVGLDRSNDQGTAGVGHKDRSDRKTVQVVRVGNESDLAAEPVRLSDPPYDDPSPGPAVSR